MERVKRLRPYNPRLDGVPGDTSGSPHPGGIFGQRISPANRMGIFESRYALPWYAEAPELEGGTLYPDKLTPDVTTADPVERKIHAPDLGPEGGSWRKPYPTAPKKRPARRVVPRRVVKRRLALGADPVITPSEPMPVAPAPVAPAPAPQRSGWIGACALVALGIVTAKVIFS